MKIHFVALFLFSIISLSYSQKTVSVNVLSGSSDTDCVDLASPPDPLWGVRVNGGNYEYYPPFGFCQANFPDQTYAAVYDCDEIVPDSIEICFEALENESLTYCIVIPDCEEEICLKYPIPDVGSQQHTLVLEDGISTGQVLFEIQTTGGTQPAYDSICGAIDFGILEPNQSLGLSDSSQFYNYCATNDNEPEPSDFGASWYNQVGVWFSFTTSNEALPYIQLIANSDPSNLGDGLSIQMAVFTAEGCSEPMEFVESTYSSSDFNEELVLFCAQPNTTYYILIDGTVDNFSTTYGYFGLSVTALDVAYAGDQICDATDLGLVPDGGVISSGSTLLSNECQSIALDPIVSDFSNQHTVWATFVAPSSGNCTINGFSSQTNGQIIDMEMAVFGTSNNTCTGALQLLATQDLPGNNDVSISLECLDAGQPYWIMIDGDVLNSEGAFSIEIQDDGGGPPFLEQDIVLCFGESFTVGVNNYDSTGVYNDIFSLPDGCDSTVVTNLLVLDSLFASLDTLQIASYLNAQDGSIELSISGGLPPYTVAWSDGIIGPNRSDLIGGESYCIQIIDSNTCQWEECFIMPFNDELNITITVEDTQCDDSMDGYVSIGVELGLAPYTLNWINPAGDTAQFEILAGGDPIDLTNLFGGLYQCYLSDASGIDTSFVVEVGSPDPLNADLINQLDATCFGSCDGLLEVEISGGVPPYFYNWSNGGNLSQISNLCAGVYTLTVTYNTDCMTEFSFEVTEPDQIDGLIIETELISCRGGDNGALEVQSNQNNLSFLWNTGETTKAIDTLSAGTYSVTLTDDTGCSRVLEYELEEPEASLAISSIILNEVSCNGFSDGIIQSVPFGGVGPYQINWSTGDQTETIFNLGDGSYTFSVVDANGCAVDSTVVLVEPAPLEGGFTSRDVICDSVDFGGIISFIDVGGGTPEYSYSSDGFFFQPNPVISNLGPGQYTAAIQDAKGCKIEFEVSIGTPPTVEAEIGEDYEIFLGETTTLDLVTNDDEADVFWTLNGELFQCPPMDCSSLEDLILLVDTDVEVLVLNAQTNCSASASLTVTVNEDYSLYFPNAISPNGDGINDIFYPYDNEAVDYIENFYIFDRYGSILFENENFQGGQIAQGWDGTFKGKDMNTGVYVFSSKIRYINGQTKIFKGTVTLLR